MNHQARSEQLQLALTKTANTEIQSIDFLDSPEALTDKNEAETGQVTNIGSLSDFDDWLHEIN